MCKDCVPPPKKITRRSAPQSNPGSDLDVSNQELQVALRPRYIFPYFITRKINQIGCSAFIYSELDLYFSNAKLLSQICNINDHKF